MLDYILERGRIIDAHHPEGYRADIALSGDRIVRIGDLKDLKAKRRIDLEGMVVSPGFIDSHSHSDQTLLIDPMAESKIRQGVTTEIIGNCGSSAAPFIFHSQAEQDFRGLYLDKNWETIGSYFEQVLELGVAVNLMSLVGHNNLRGSVMGLKFKEAEAGEINAMQRMLSRALEEGGIGLSTGLIYPPGSFSTTSELVHLSRCLGRYGGLYVTHLRGEGEDLLNSLAEAIEIGFAAGVPVHISHHKVLGSRSWGQSEKTLAMMQEARDQGLDISCDLYPYQASSTTLIHLLPPWTLEGGFRRLRERLQNPEIKALIKRDIEKGLPHWESALRSVQWNDIIVSYSRNRSEYEGRSIFNLARMQEEDPYQFFFDLILADRGESTVVIFEIEENDIKTILRDEYTMIGSDGYALSHRGSLLQGRPHPRSFSTFPRVLEKYVRELNLLSLGEAIKRMTYLPAQRFGLRERGLVKEGYYADLVVFDPELIAERSTYLSPCKYPEGIEYVFVNGGLVLDQGNHTGCLQGRVIRRKNPSKLLRLLPGENYQALAAGGEE